MSRYENHSRFDTKARLTAGDASLWLVPGDAETLYERGCLFTRLAYFSLALDAFDQSLTLRPDHPRTGRARARAHRVMEAIAGGYRCSRRGTLRLWAERLLNAGLLDEALAATSASLAIEWADPWAYRCRARILVSLAQRDEARRALANALWVEGDLDFSE